MARNLRYHYPKLAVPSRCSRLMRHIIAHRTTSFVAAFCVPLTQPACVPSDTHACPDRRRTTGKPAARATTARLERLPRRHTRAPRALSRTAQISPPTPSATPAPWVSTAEEADRIRRTVPVRRGITARCERRRRPTTLAPPGHSRTRHRSTWRRSARTAHPGTLSYDEAMVLRTALITY